MPRVTASRLLFVVFLIAFATLFFYSKAPLRSDGYYDDGVTESSELEDNEVHGGSEQLEEVPDLSRKRLEFRKLDGDAYALSAFTDDRNGNMGYKFVRIMMVITKKSKFGCVIKGKESEEVSLYEFSENHARRMKLFILNCKMPNGVEFNDLKYVKIVRKTSGASIDVPISYRIQDEKSLTPDEYDLKMSICVPALYGDAYDAKRIVEFVEVNNLQGIDQILIYYSPSEISDVKTKQVLEYYQNNKMVNLVEFSIPFDIDDIWYHGQLATITDCLLRTTGVSKYTFFNDIDEFFVPVQRNLTLYETLSLLFDNQKIGSQRTSLKYISTKNKNAPITLNNKVSVKRFESRFTKCVVRPEMVFEQGIHHTSRVIQDDYLTASHNGSLLRIYHYKEPTYCCEDESLIAKRHRTDLQKQFDYVVGLLKL